MRRRAFTLIELLIVVAIIAILAAIAVPNFLEAQVRAKVSRAKSDLRTLATAIESYGVDSNRYPPHRSGAGEIAYPERYVILTTPVAFMTSIAATVDPFVTEPAGGQGGSGIYYSYTNFASFDDTHPLAPAVPTHRWLLRSRGPDSVNESNDVRNEFHVNGLTAISESWIYDPTNGSVSRGDVSRTARYVP
ncbi:MAG: prepilin-type N-terminal cleavage/methylation domain-containing protein [Candidatus Sumerlaeia bacterium]|nr:prepilin-type N-terminal cleavage/methylation domain-containing protein [Candidatus Sumerlaeia bacterium]